MEQIPQANLGEIPEGTSTKILKGAPDEALAVRSFKKKILRGPPVGISGGPPETNQEKTAKSNPRRTPREVPEGTREGI